jgi:mono/diheme cytochrome c family protein
MRKWILAMAVAAAAAATIFWILTEPSTIAAGALPVHQPDPANGERMFNAAGCASCHIAPGSKDKTRLAGGVALRTPFGTFRAPNISPDPDAGIGGWSDIQFVNAVMRGVSPSGRHYYPAFPYTSYQRMDHADVLDIKAYVDTLPAVKSEVPGHDLPLPFRLRRGLGLWKLLYLDGRRFQPDPAATDEINRGAYLVQGPGHCGECHTPRNLIGGPMMDRMLAGGPAPEGDGVIPNITPDPTGIGDWSAKDIAYALESGFTPEFDAFGGAMVSVQDNLAKLPEEDRAAIAAYLKSVPAVKSAPKKPKTE